MDSFYEDFNPCDLTLIRRKDATQLKLVPQLLVDDGYSFKSVGYGRVVMSGRGMEPYELCFGIYNFWFLLHWLEWSLDISPCGYNGEFHKASGGGGLTLDSRCGTDGSLYQPRDLGMYTDFADDRQCVGSGLVPVIWLKDNCDFDYSELESLEQGYWKKDIGFGDVNREKWRKALEAASFSFLFHPNRAELYFTNARNWLPPNAQLLGLSKLEFSRESRASVEGCIPSGAGAGFSLRLAVFTDYYQNDVCGDCGASMLDVASLRSVYPYLSDEDIKLIVGRKRLS